MIDANTGSPERPFAVNEVKSIRCVAGILVGGRSTRMGRPKTALPLADGRTLVEHVAEVASRTGRWIEEVVILGQGPPLPESLAVLPILADVKPGAGPLAGLCALLRHAGQRWCLLLACDMPLLEPSLLERLAAAVTPDCDAVAYRRADRPGSWHACCALYHPRLLPASLVELKQGKGSLQKLLASTRLIAIDPDPGDQRMLVNLNTPEDYERLSRRP